MNARDALRQYLEQRRELGESELVLDTMSVEDAMKLIGANDAPAASTARQAPRTVQSPKPVAKPSAPAGGGPWRDTLRQAGGSPPTERERPAPAVRATPQERSSASGATPVPSAASAASAASAVPAAPVIQEIDLAQVPTGLVVGGTNRAIFQDEVFKLESLETVAAAIGQCRRCPLYATATNPVPGAGNPNADFMIVGEAPGANEDAQGVPFVGQAGQLLTKIIGAIGLTRDDVFIANVLKHRPPGNRNPASEEIAACSPYLIRQIELVKPKVILALGTFAAQTLLESKLTIGKLREQIHRYYGVPLIVTYHPAALLRNPAWKRPTWEDVQLARRILDRANAADPGT